MNNKRASARAELELPALGFVFFLAVASAPCSFGLSLHAAQQVVLVRGQVGTSFPRLVPACPYPPKPPPQRSLPPCRPPSDTSLVSLFKPQGSPAAGLRGAWATRAAPRLWGPCLGESLQVRVGRPERAECVQRGFLAGRSRAEQGRQQGSCRRGHGPTHVQPGRFSSVSCLSLSGFNRSLPKESVRSLQCCELRGPGTCHEAETPGKQPQLKRESSLLCGERPLGSGGRRRPHWLCPQGFRFRRCPVTPGRAGRDGSSHTRGESQPMTSEPWAKVSMFLERGGQS